MAPLHWVPNSTGASRRSTVADSDQYQAVEAINNITGDAESIDLYYKLAERRCKVLVEHYAPEIETLAAALVERGALTGDEARELLFQSLKKRRGGLRSW